jgi:hypothetical protein
MASCAPVVNRRQPNLLTLVQAGYQPAAGSQPAPHRTTRSEDSAQPTQRRATRREEDILFQSWMRKRLGKACFCLALGIAAMGGANMRPDEIEELLHSMNQPKLAHTITKLDDQVDPLRKLLRPERQ